MDQTAGVIEVDLFPADVNSLDHPDVVSFKELLEDVAREYQCSLVSFDIDRGTASFSFSSDELMAEVLKTLQDRDRRDP
jgi:hypothetical protein